MSSNCMYGAPHPGDAVFVRNKMGRTVGELCGPHYKQHQKALANVGYHFRTPEELAVREGKEFQDDGREETNPQLDQEPDGAWSHIDNDGPGDSEESPRLAPVEPDSDRPIRGPSSALAPTSGPEQGRLVPTERAVTTKADMAQRLPDIGTTARRDTDAGGRELRTRPVPELAWWQGAGELELTIEQTTMLRAPFPPGLAQQNYEKEWFIPWVYIWQRMLDVFTPDIPSLVPLREPMIEKDHVLVHYCMLVRGQFAGEAWGYCERKGGNSRMDVGNAIESATSEAIRRIGKRNGVGLELWDHETIKQLEGRSKRG